MTAAERILHAFGISTPHEIDLEVIAWDQGAIVNYRPLESCEARIIGSSRKAVISVNCRSPQKRQRFSLAHELGHWHYDRGRVLFCDKADIGNHGSPVFNPEKRADSFASDLILPDFLLAPRLNKIKRPTLAVARDISEEFCASLTATLLKMTLSNAFPMVIACYNKSKQRRWFERAPMIQPWWFPLKILDSDTYASDLFFNEAAEQTHPLKMPADAWFDFKGAGRFEVSEQSFLLPDDEMLVVLNLPDAAIA